jgi:hypothetical protein
MKKLGEEELPEPSPIVSEESSPENDAQANEIEKRKEERAKRTALMLIEAGLKEAGGKGLLGTKEVDVSDRMSSAFVSLLSGGSPSVNPLIGRIKSKKNLGVEYNSEYNKKAKEEFRKIMTEARTIYVGRFDPLYRFQKESEKDRLSDENVHDAHSDMISRLILSKNKISFLRKNSPAYIITKEMIPHLVSLFQALKESFNEHKEKDNDESLSRLYYSIVSLKSFLDAYEPARINFKPQVSQTEKKDKARKKGKNPEAPTTTLPLDIESLRIRQIIPFQGFSQEDGGLPESPHRVADPLLEDLVFGIEFNRDVGGFDSKEILESLLNSRQIKISSALEDRGSYSSAITEYGKINIVKVIVRARAVAQARKAGSQFIFKVERSGSSAHMEEEVTASKTDQLKKLSYATTSPLYEASSPSGEKISFTPTDLVAGTGYLTDSKGKRFRPKKMKAKSLASKVTSKGFGKVKK